MQIDYIVQTCKNLETPPKSLDFTGRTTKKLSLEIGCHEMLTKLVPKAGHSREVQAIPLAQREVFFPPAIQVDRLGRSFMEAPKFVLRTLV
ncbi:hypothetical protein AVEN_56049-1 [Araneus ventricosus]|uniref:Uncharacterized protein n=1 Tax=Araneus ventricosus TaxID=182803 RepID=A0A4Y2DPN9_ARAVE|nr:hypothetical protein AVEN_56049-1 [Araneus ventricosus]